MTGMSVYGMTGVIGRTGMSVYGMTSRTGAGLGAWNECIWNDWSDWEDWNECIME